MKDEQFMHLALQLAQRGCGWTAPNPMVGAVIVKDGRIIGQGWHQRCGEPHAERNALAACTEDPRGATLYVTLEPCCHYGKQPPCTEAILAASIAHVAMDTFGHTLDAAHVLPGGDAELVGVAGAAVFIDSGELGENQAAAALGTILIEADQLRGGFAVPGGKSVAHSGHCNTHVSTYASAACGGSLPSSSSSSISARISVTKYSPPEVRTMSSESQ